MKIHECKQGGPEWLRLRMGMPTSSRFDDIVTPGGKLSASSDKYMYELLAELITGGPLKDTKTSWMERGTDMEAEAVDFYELDHEKETEKIGFITNDAMTIGASPDRKIIGENIGVEIKCHKPEVHVGLLLKNPIGDKHKVQIQGQILVCEFDAVDIVGYCPQMPNAIHRVYRDEEYIAKLATALDAFVENLQMHIADFKQRGFIHEPSDEPAAHWLGVRDEDLDALLAEKFPSVEFSL